MNINRKRKRKIENDEGAEEMESKEIRKFERYKKRILRSSENQEKMEKTLKKLIELLHSSKDDPSVFTSICERINIEFISTLLIRYNATVTAFDRSIFSVLNLLETTYGINIALLQPLVWGNRSKSNYDSINRFGQSLHSRLSHNQVLNYLNPELVWFTLLNLDRKMNVKTCYDSRFILLLLFSILDEGFELSNRLFVQRNGLSFAFAATACNDQSQRAIGYSILKRFFNRCTMLTTESFVEKPLFIYLLSLFRNSITNPNERVPHVISFFFAKACKLLLNPGDPLYTPILNYLVYKPSVNFQIVPDFLRLLFFSSSTEFHNEERHWFLKLILDSIVEPNDYFILTKSHGIRLCLSLFASNIANAEARKLILLILKSIMSHTLAAKHLYYTYSIHSWIGMTIQIETLTRWEVVFLCELFTTLFELVKNAHLDNNAKLDSNDCFLSIYNLRTVKLVAKKVLEVLSRNSDEGFAKWSPKLGLIIEDDIPISRFLK